MIKQKFGWANVDVPLIGQGTWLIDNDDDSRAIKTLQTGLDLGMTHIDTAAEMYGNGKAEELVGQDIAARKRKDIFLDSNVLPSNASYEGTIKACKNSLKRLNQITLIYICFIGQAGII